MRCETRQTTRHCDRTQMRHIDDRYALDLSTVLAQDHFYSDSLSLLFDILDSLTIHEDEVVIAPALSVFGRLPQMR